MFSELSHSTRLIENCQSEALFDEKFEWPVASDVKDGDTIEVTYEKAIFFK